MDSCRRCKEHHEHVMWVHSSCQRCMQHHEHMVWEHNNLHDMRFLIRMTGDFWHRLKIPKRFTAKVTLQEVIKIKCPSGRPWRIRLAKRGSTTYLQDGWEDFVEAHHLEEHDTLMFGYEGDYKFRVKAYDSSGFDKGCPSSGGNQHSEDAEEVDRHSKEIPRPRTRIAPDSSSYSGESSPSYNVQGREEDYPERGHWKGKRTWVPKSENTSEETVRVNQSENKNSRRRLATGIERDLTMELASQLRTRGPSFTKKMKDYNVKGQFQLLIPTDFLKEFFPHIQEIVLQVPKEKREWKVNVRASRLLGGWRNFARDNKLKEGDLCVFMLSKCKKTARMTVHIIRAIRH